MLAVLQMFIWNYQPEKVSGSCWHLQDESTLFSYNEFKQRWMILKMISSNVKNLHFLFKKQTIISHLSLEEHDKIFCSSCCSCLISDSNYRMCFSHQCWVKICTVQMLHHWFFMFCAYSWSSGPCTQVRLVCSTSDLLDV